MAKGLSGNDHLLTVTSGGAARTHNPLPNIVVVPFTPSFLLVSFFILVLTHWKPLIWCIYTMTFLSSTVACWRSALLALPPPSQWAAGFRSIRKKEKEVELAALWCSHRFFPWALGGCPASTLQCDYACVRGVGDSVLNIYFGIYKYVNFFFFFFCMGFSYSTHHLLLGSGWNCSAQCVLPPSLFSNSWWEKLRLE